ncbi:MAG: alpha/beta hydrolase [Myxococcota bacterium]
MPSISSTHFVSKAIHVDKMSITPRQEPLDQTIPAQVAPDKPVCRSVWRHMIGVGMEAHYQWSGFCLSRRGFVSRLLPTQFGSLRAFDGVNSKAPIDATVVVLHGFGASSLDYADLMMSVSKQVKRVIGIDLPGHGGSVTVANATVSQMGAALCEAVSGLDVKSPLVVFGNSMGGLAASLLALYPGNQVDALVLSSPAGAPMTEEAFSELKSIFSLRDCGQADSFVQRIFANPPRGFMRHVYQGAVRNQFEQPALHHLLATVSSKDLLTAQSLSALHAKTTVYWGEQDKVLPKEQEDFWKLCRNQAIRVVDVPGAGHMPFFEDLKLVSGWIVDACREASKGAKVN